MCACTHKNILLCACVCACAVVRAESGCLFQTCWCPPLPTDAACSCRDEALRGGRERRQASRPHLSAGYASSLSTAEEGETEQWQSAEWGGERGHRSGRAKTALSVTVFSLFNSRNCMLAEKQDLERFQRSNSQCKIEKKKARLKVKNHTEQV